MTWDGPWGGGWSTWSSLSWRTVLLATGGVTVEGTSACAGPTVHCTDECKKKYFWTKRSRRPEVERQEATEKDTCSNLTTEIGTISRTQIRVTCESGAHLNDLDHLSW